MNGLDSKFKEKIVKDLPFSNLTTLKIGGPIKYFFEAKTEDELIEAVKFAQKNSLPYLVIGGGSNLLVSDKGYDGLVIKNSITGIARGDSEERSWRVPAAIRQRPESEDTRRETELAGPGAILKVKGGTVLQDLVDYSIKNGLSGLQKMTGIPGTIAGAVYGNAGAYGQTISDHIVKVTILKPTTGSSFNLIGGSSQIDSRWSLPRTSIRDGNDNTEIKTLTKDACGFDYRHSSFKENKSIILEVIFELEQGNPKTLKKESEEILEKRLVKYPKGIKCPGSFFMNIVTENLPKDVLEKIPQNMIMYGKIPAGALLEEVGAKGDSIDGIEIAPYHANLFVNKGGGKAEDFYNLAKKYFQKVKEKFGITLEPEVQLINLPALN
ncbi:UDP-N-acetylmuramate dehydrogenase [Candidatus Daviesbacteria bacterium]|nr:UDP-N-acetylmuramate dehydrogenase [Candidatus Daviesbacteria bacterium]